MSDNVDKVSAIREIGFEMADQIIEGVREYCAAHPNPQLDPMRHFFLELGYGLEAMSHDDLLALCAATLTRIAYPNQDGGAQ